MPPFTITTPEHVGVRLEPAGVGSRFLAIMIDSMITFGTSSVILWLAMTLLPSAIAGAIFITTSSLLTWGWHVWFETRHGGQTPGKLALSLRVVDARRLPVALFQALVRT